MTSHLIREVIAEAKTLFGLPGIPTVLRWGITREGLVDLALLVGKAFEDGVKGIGPEQAIELVQQHGTIEAMPAKICAAIGDVQPPRRIYLSPHVTDAYTQYAGRARHRPAGTLFVPPARVRLGSRHGNEADAFALLGRRLMTPVVLSVFGVVFLALVRISDRRIVIAQPALSPASQLVIRHAIFPGPVPEPLGSVLVDGCLSFTAGSRQRKEVQGRRVVELAPARPCAPNLRHVLLETPCLDDHLSLAGGQDSGRGPMPA